MVNPPSVSLTGLRLFRVVAVALLILVWPVLTGSAKQDPPGADDPLALQPDQSYFSQLPFEHVDIINGNLLLTFTDLALPGDAGMDLRFVRSYNHQDEEQKWTFGIAGVPIFVDTENQPATFDPVLVSADGGRQVARPVGGSTFLTQDFLRYDRATLTLEMPNGWVATYYSGSSPNDRMLERVTDPFGNTITPTWEPDSFRPQRLNAVVQTASGATRRVEFGYNNDSGRMPSQMRLKDGGANGGDRVWDYAYGPTVQPDTLVKMLTQVTPPAGAPWTFAHTYGSGSTGTDTVVVTTANGGTVSYGLSRSAHAGADFGYRARVATRTTGGRAIPVGAWTFEWGKNPGRVTLPDGRVLTFVHEFAGTVFGRRWLLTSKTLSGDGTTASITREYEQLPVTTSLGIKVITKELIVQDGRQYVTDYEYSGNNNGDYHHPYKITASSGGRERQIDRSYQHSSSPYLLALMASETIGVVGGESATSSFQYNGAGFLTQETVTGITTTYAPSAQGNRASSTDANSHTTTYTYEWGMLKDTTNPLYGIQRSVRLDGAVTAETRNGATTTYTFDNLGRPTEVAPPGVDATVTEYFADRVVTTRGNSASETSVDGFGRPTEVVTAENVCVKTSYDADGRKTFQSDPSNGCGGGGDTFEFDFLGRITKITHADNTFVTRAYGAGTVTITDEEGRSTTQTWEAFGNPADAVLIELLDANGELWKYEYNHLNSLAKVDSPVGPDRTWAYDSVTNLLENEVHPESGTTQYTYDAAGNLATKEDAQGQVFTYEYDDVNRLTKIDAPNGPVDHDVRFEYDAADNRTRSANGLVDTRDTYDTANRLRQREVIIGGTRSFVTVFEPDSRDNLEHIQYPSRRRVDYTFDNDGRPTAAVDATGAVYANGVGYHASGVVSGLAFGNQLQETVSEYPQSRRPWQIQSGPLNITYAYDNVGNVVSVTDGRGSSFNSTFGYDALDRLTTVNGYGGKTFEYDALGNRTLKSTPVGDVGYFYDAATNRVITTTGPPVLGEAGSYGYDNNGNTTQDVSSTYLYTPFNMIASATVGGATTSYTYDGDGVRAVKDGVGGVRYFIHGLNGQLLAEYEDAGTEARVVREYIYLGSRLVASIGREDESAPAPVVTVTSPVGTAPHPAGGDITIQATVTNALGITRVEFYADGVLLGSDTTAPYEWLWSSVPSGEYSVLARGVLANGLNVPSAAVPVTVLGTMAIDSPLANAAVDAPFTISGWAIDENAATGTGVDTVHVWAYYQGQAPALLIGAATMGLSRPDVAEDWGPQFANAGFEITVTAAKLKERTSPNPVTGSWLFVAYAHSTVENAFTQERNVTVTVRPIPYGFIDCPQLMYPGEPTYCAGSVVSQTAGVAYMQSPFTVAGWAIDYAASTGTGVSTLHVWAYPASGAPAQFVGAVSYGGARPDIKALFGDNFEYSGFGLTAELAPGAYTLAVFPWSIPAGGFTQAMTMDIVVQSGPFASADQIQAGGPSPDGSPEMFVANSAMADTGGWAFSPLLPITDETLTVDLVGTGTGTVTSSPSGLATCSGTSITCVGTFAGGTVVTLTAAPASGHEFVEWSGACSGTSTCTVTLTSARYVAARFRLVTPPVVTRYYHVDALGSVRAVTKEDRSEARRDDYHAFGEAGTPPMGDSIRFTGKERDAETALDYFGARYYRNLMGRFTTVDPDHVDGNIFDPQSWNAYAYARNNPLRFVDPTGTQAQCPSGHYCETVNVTAKKPRDMMNALEDVNTMAGWLGFSDVVLQAGKRAVWARAGIYFPGPTFLAGCAIYGCSAGEIGFAAIPLIGKFPAFAKITFAESRSINGVLKQLANGTTKGKPFDNVPPLLPVKTAGYYTEHTVSIAGTQGRGQTRLIIGDRGEIYYSRDHYTTPPVRIR